MAGDHGAHRHGCTAHALLGSGLHIELSGQVLVCAILEGLASVATTLLLLPDLFLAGVVLEEDSYLHCLVLHTRTQRHGVWKLMIFATLPVSEDTGKEISRLLGSRTALLKLGVHRLGLEDNVPQSSLLVLSKKLHAINDGVSRHWSHWVGALSGSRRR